MKRHPVNDIPSDAYFSKAGYLDDRFVLIAPETPFTMDTRNLLLKWKFKEILSDGEYRMDYHPENDAAFDSHGEIPETRVLTDREKIKQAEVFYNSFIEYAETLFTDVVIKGKLEFKNVVEKIKEVCDFIKV
ncbi:MAG: HD-GYP domain-containing protein, partial [Spirochaetaceae bacterium]|nr:HD-GYP domain-containing protein [Spirochaetaceae bacterium]